MQSTSGFYQHKQRSHLRSSLSSSTRASRIHRAAHETRSGLKQFAMNPRPRTAASAKRLMRRASRSWTASGGSSFLSDPLQKQLSVGRAIDDDAEPSPRQSAGQVPGQSTSRPGLRNTTPSHTKTLLDLHPSPGSSATPSPNPAPATRRKSVVKKKKITSNRRRSTFGLTSRSSAADEDGEFPDPDRKTGSRRSSATSFEEEPSIVDLLDSDEDEDSRSSAPASPAIHANPEGSGKGVDVFYIKTWQQKNPRGVSEVPKTAEFAWRDATLRLRFQERDERIHFDHLRLTTCNKGGMSLQRVTRTGGKDAIVDAFDILFCSHSPDPMTTVRGRLAAYHAKARISSSDGAVRQKRRRSPRLHASSQVPSAKHLFRYNVNGVTDTLSISSTDLHRLANPTEYLNDNCVDFYIKTLFYGDGGDSRGRFFALRSRVYCFSSLFFGQLFKRDLPRSTAKVIEGCDFDRVKRWTKNVDIFDRDLLLIPICKGAHWSVVAVFHPNHFHPTESRGSPRKQTEVVDLAETPTENEKDNCTKAPVQIVHLDSLHLHRTGPVIKAVKHYLSCEYYQRKAERKIGFQMIQNNIELQVKKTRAKVPLQPNGFDCGMYVLMYIKSILTILLEKCGPADLTAADDDDDTTAAAATDETNGVDRIPPGQFSSLSWEDFEAHEAFAFRHRAVKELRERIAIHISTIESQAKSGETRPAADSEIEGDGTAASENNSSEKCSRSTDHDEVTKETDKDGVDPSDSAATHSPKETNQPSGESLKKGDDDDVGEEPASSYDTPEEPWDKDASAHSSSVSSSSSHKDTAVGCDEKGQASSDGDGDRKRARLVPSTATISTSESKERVAGSRGFSDRARVRCTYSRKDTTKPSEFPTFSTKQLTNDVKALQKKNKALKLQAQHKLQIQQALQ